MLPFDIEKRATGTINISVTCPTEDEVRILVVDDQEVIRESLCIQLNASGYSSRSCNLLDETVSLVGFWQPHLVMLDLRMPIHDGYEVLEKIREIQDVSPIIVAMTGDATDSVRKKCEQAGFDHFLTKPFRIGEIQKIVASKIASAWTF